MGRGWWQDPARVSEYIEEINTIIRMKDLYANLGQLLTPAECEDLALEVLHHLQLGKVIEERDTRFYKNSFGGDTPGAWECLHRFTPLAIQKSGKNLKAANPYCRIYNNGSTLNPHVDRPGLDWTISICLYSDISHPWPLIVKSQTGELIEFVTACGEGSLVAGLELEHWREPLQCEESQSVIQMFLHWTDVEVPSPTSG